MKFKVSVIYSLLTIALLTSCVQTKDKEERNEYTISGSIGELDVNMGRMAIRDSTAKRGFRLDTIVFDNGSFTHTATITEPEVFRMSFNSKKIIKWVGDGYIPTKSALLMFVAYPGADIKVNGEALDYVNAFPEGDYENNTMAKLNKSIYPLMNDMVNLMVKNEVDSTLTEEQKEINYSKAEEFSKQVKDNKIEFLSTNASSIAGLWLMEDMLIRSQIEIEQVAELMETVDAKYSDVSYFKKLTARVEGFKATGAGMTAPNITGINALDGQVFDMSSLRGKYIIIDFWGTWCHACLEGVPEMKAFQEKHADRVQIVGVAKDNSMDKVKASMLEHKMNWPSVMFEADGNDYVSNYNVQGYPTKILVDRKGKVVFRFVGEKAEFYDEVEKVITR